MKSERKRQLKVQSKYRPSPSLRMNAGGKNVPCLTLNGIWLEELGFKTGDTVSITSSEKLLVIRVLEEGFQNETDTTP